MIWDCIIIGGGPAGLTAATYLGRFQRTVLLIDSGQSRLKRVPLSRNTPGFPDGVTGTALYALMHDQAMRYGASRRDAEATSAQVAAHGFRIGADQETFDARTLLLATGVKLVEPEIAGLDDALRRGLIRYCPICDGYEARDARIAVLGGRAGAIGEAHFLRTYSQHVTYLWQLEGAPSAAERAEAARDGITLGAAPVSNIEIDSVVRVRDERGSVFEFDTLYPCMGCHPRSALAVSLGADVSQEGGLITDAHQQTSIPGLYAAGDVLQGLDQIASACGQAAIAAVAIHNALRS